MTDAQKSFAAKMYLILAACFIAALVACNLIFQKFFHWTPLSFLGDNALGRFTFEISVGIIPYPITFLITDILSEVYGRKKADDVVKAGLVATLFTLVIVYTAKYAPATDWSPINDETFTHVFGNTFIAIGASMVAYLFAQFVDIRLFHFWKRVTKGKMLWLRNNFSTIGSQIIDTLTILLLLCTAEIIEWSLFWGLFWNGLIFKICVALLDTPLFYLTTYFIRKRLSLSLGQEVQL